MREDRVANLRRELERTHDAVHRSHLEYELCRELLEQAIADAERSHRRLASRLATIDRCAERSAHRLRAPHRIELDPTPAPRRDQRSAATISVAHATAS